MTAGKSASAGAGIFSGAKLTALIISAAALAVGAAGVNFYAQSNTPSPAVPSPAPVAVMAPGPGAQPASDTPPNSDESLIHEAYVQCFPRDVTRYLFNDLPSLADQIQAAGWNTSLTGKLYVSPLATSVDQKSHVWIAYPFSAKSDGSGNLDLGNTSTTGPAGIVTDPDEFVPVTRTPNQSMLGGIAHGVLSLVGVAGFQAPYHMTAHVNGPWPAGKYKKFLEISQWQSGDAIGPDLDGLYPVHLLNSPGNHCIQQLIFVAPKGWEVKSSSQPPAETTPVGDFVVSVWQKEVSPKETFQVDLKLNRTPLK